VTSPVISNPSTEMLEKTVSSYLDGTGLARCSKVLVSDGYTVAAPSQQPKQKSGRVAQDWVAPYEEFRDRVDKLVAAGGAFPGPLPDMSVPNSFWLCSHLRLPDHRGFGGCVYCGLRRVTTPYVLVVQHDRPLVRPFSASSIVRAMEASHGAVKYVGLPTKASLSKISPDSMMHYGIPKRECTLPPEVSQAAAVAGIELRVLPFWYDSSHICLVSHYMEFVFLKGRVPGGAFPEDSVGQELVTELKNANGTWREVHAAFSTFLVVDGPLPMVGHFRGRKYRDLEERKRLGWTGWRLPRPPKPESDGDEELLQGLSWDGDS